MINIRLLKLYFLQIKNHPVQTGGYIIQKWLRADSNALICLETNLACIGPEFDPSWVLRSKEVQLLFNYMLWNKYCRCGFPTIGSGSDQDTSLFYKRPMSWPNSIGYGV